MLRVLVIDDSRTITDFLWNSLTREGFEVLTAANGFEGINMIEEYQPDLVITDIIMPARNGIEVVMHLRMNHPDTRVIVMTSGGYIPASVHLDNIMKLGADAYLKKPFGEEDILNAISEVLELVAA